MIDFALSVRIFVGNFLTFPNALFFVLLHRNVTKESNIPLKYKCGSNQFNDHKHDNIFCNNELPIMLMAKPKEKLHVQPCPEENIETENKITDWCEKLQPLVNTTCGIKPDWSAGIDISS